ncbi:hypothetical protein [Fusobacterium russii]|uniref:hypothetical protein n=1 Tax=Fusobacterium russii TaxID=854 RepID=UPI00039C2A70
MEFSIIGLSKLNFKGYIKNIVVEIIVIKFALLKSKIKEALLLGNKNIRQKSKPEVIYGIIKNGKKGIFFSQDITNEGTSFKVFA